MSGRYDDIINLPHYVSKTHPRLSAEQRAAQFAPFAALSGYGEAINETGRLTNERVELDEYEKAEINGRLLGASGTVLITYFLPDEKKEGGKYVTISGEIKKLDEYERTVVLAGGGKIPIDDIVDIAEAVDEKNE